MFHFVRFLSSQGWGGDMPHKRAALVISVVASGCVLLAGCGGSSSSSNSGGSAAGPMKKVTNDSSAPGGGASGTGARLTGNFCTDFKNIGQRVRIPASAQSDPGTLQRHGAQYLTQAAAYFQGLAAEAPPQAGKELRVLAADYQAIARSIHGSNISSLSRIEKQMESLASGGATGDAFRQLVTYVTTRCLSA
jgi:hypothetical protein